MVSVLHASPEDAVRCGEVKRTAVRVFNISYVHLNECDADSDTIVLKKKLRCLCFL